MKNKPQFDPLTATDPEVVIKPRSLWPPNDWFDWKANDENETYPEHKATSQEATSQKAIRGNLPRTR